ncbi:MAG: ribonuclease HI [Sedimentisphaerales bacterium]|nr:ribonuclease HI [Sedimentisphaerales bacterium]
MMMTEVTIYTDGGCHGNPGPGGYGVVLLSGQHRKELSGGYQRTTNNRMELLACIRALEALKQTCRVRLHSDSKYIVDSITKGWARRWRANDWRRNRTEKAINPDLWARLLDLCERHEVKFIWVRGHAGNKENERCDALVQKAIAGGKLKEDTNYVRPKTAS